MAFSIIQAGTGLQFLDTEGALTTLTLPANVTLRSDVPPRFLVYGNFVFLVNTPSTPLTIDAAGTVRPVTPSPPAIAPTVSAGTVGTLSGTYAGIRVTFLIKDADGNVIAESDFSPASNSVTIALKNLRVDNIPTSSEAISARRLYRPTTSGTTLFPWLDVDGNTITSVQDDLADAGLSLIAAPILGNPPHLTHIREWRNLLWGVGDIAIDTLVFTRPEAFYSWPVTNSIPVPGSGSDTFGIRALMPRREALGVGRRDVIWQVTGDTVDDFSLVKLSENTGIESQESVAIYRDVVFWLWKDGVYQWDANGINNISDMAVGSWFNTDSYFNQNLFSSAFAVFDVTRLKYRLYLAAAGSYVVDRWIEYDLSTKTWWGPHKTAAFTPTSSFLLTDAADKSRAIAGSRSGFIYQEGDAAADDGLGIDFEVQTRAYDGNTPHYEKFFGELSVIGKKQERGIMTITPHVGYLGAERSPVFVYDMTKGRERLGRIGVGKFAQLTFKHTQADEPVELYGFQAPFHIVGNR